MAKKKRVHEFEYRLTIAPHINERRQVRTILFTLETTKAFANFRYELSVHEELKEKTLQFTVAGLKAPKLSLPASGTAQFVREYDNLKGKYDITVQSLDGTVNTFTVNFTSRHITVLKSPRSPFIELLIA